MKRFFKTLLVLLLVVTPVTFASAKKTTTPAKEAPGKVTMYVFYGDGCPHCSELEEYIKNTLRNDESVKGKFEVVYYEVWNVLEDGKTPDDHPQNKELLSAVSTKLTGKAATGVPFYVIGEKYFSGYGETFNSEIVNTILTQAANPEYKDVVAEAINGMTTKPEVSNPELGDESEANEKSNKTDVVGLVILGVTVVVVLAIIFTRHTDEEDEEEVEETKTEVKAEKKEAKAEKKEVKAEVKVEKKETNKTDKKENKTGKKTASKSTATKKKSTKKKTSKK